MPNFPRSQSQGYGRSRICKHLLRTITPSEKIDALEQSLSRIKEWGLLFVRQREFPLWVGVLGSMRRGQRSLVARGSNSDTTSIVQSMVLAVSAISTQGFHRQDLSPGENLPPSCSQQFFPELLPTFEARRSAMPQAIRFGAVRYACTYGSLV